MEILKKIGKIPSLRYKHVNTLRRARNNTKILVFTLLQSSFSKAISWIAMLCLGSYVFVNTYHTFHSTDITFDDLAMVFQQDFGFYW